MNNSTPLFYRFKWIVSIDLKENAKASENILVAVDQSLQEQQASIDKKLEELLSGGLKLNAILNVAGGWAGGSASSPQLLANADLMWKQSVWSSLIASSLASRYLTENGLLTLPGAACAINSAPTPGMLGYGMAKAAVHQLVKSLSHPDAGLPRNTHTLALAPIMLDTPMNRKWMPDADTSTWTSLTFIAELFEQWLNAEEQRPKNGSIVKLTTANGQTTLSYE